jgi:hypothetical protein
MRASILIWFVVLVSTSSVSAAPAPECAKRFIGTWQVTVNSTGQTYSAGILSNGVTTADCPSCNSGTWTCSGDNITVLVNGITVHHTLAPDRRHLSGDCCTLVRKGSPPLIIEYRDAPPQGQKSPKQIAEGCVTSDAPRVSSSKCGFKAITEYSTRFRTAKREGCPKSIEISYLDPTDGKWSWHQVYQGGTEIRSCGEGVTQFKIKEQ